MLGSYIGYLLKMSNADIWDFDIPDNLLQEAIDAFYKFDVATAASDAAHKLHLANPKLRNIAIPFLTNSFYQYDELYHTDKEAIAAAAILNHRFKKSEFMAVAKVRQSWIFNHIEMQTFGGNPWVVFVDFFDKDISQEKIEEMLK